ncbi:RCC1 domain-containing protein [Paenibacillus sp. SAFN-117]|uniref:RCC1 domain-containing protein n=1 Tax=Paenibacillus sp. SAFN-117 TaxID=3436860 RepID=UPI003F7D58D8
MISIKYPIKYVSPWLIAMLFINLILSLLVIPAPTLAQESETNANLVGVFSFGMGNHGKLGHGDTDRQYTPKKIESLTDIQAIAAADNHSLALTKSGDVYSFGHGYHGELGHGDREDQLTPKKIEGLADIQAIAGGWYHSLALTKSGDVYSFGSGTFGQLGHGDTETQLTPKKIEGLSDIQAIAAGVYHSLALTKSGDVYSFGFGTHGQLGRTEDQLTPKKIEGLSDIQAIAAGGHYSLALTKSGEVYSFGSGTFGQLGHGDTETQFTPKKIEGLSDIQAIAAGSTHSLALTKSGEVYSFGKGTHGQLGHGDREDQLTPKKIESLTDIQAIAAGYYHSLALTKSGDVYSFGGGTYGQLGHGDTDRQYTPKKIESLTDIQAIAAGSTHSLALIIEATQDSTIHPDEASFDKNILKQREIAVTMELNGNTLIDITNDTTSLSEGTDYIVNGNIVTITKEYLANLPIGTTTLIFTFSAGSDATLSIAVSDSTPVPPTGLQATAGDGKVELSWTAIDAVDGYNVYRQEADEGTPPVADRWMVDNDKGPVTGTSYTVDHLTAGKLYWFAVTTVKDEMESGYSESTSETPYTTVAAVASPGAIEVGKGVAPEKLEAYLPEHIQIQLTSLPVTMDVGVKWDLEHADYNPDQAGMYAITGGVQLPGYVHNPQQLQAEIAVHVLPNTNASLSGIALNGEPLAHFDPDIYTYDVVVPYATEQVTVTAATDDPAANYEVVSEVVRGEVQPLKVGLNRIDILVTAEDQQEKVTYTLHVKRLSQEAEPEQVSKPVAEPSGGAVPAGTMVTLSTTMEGATVYYTTDGSTPSRSSVEYTAPIEVTTEMTLKAIAVKEGMLDSEVLEEQYTIATIPAPANLTASAADRSVTLKWDAVTGTGSVTYAVYQAEGTSVPVDPANWKLIQSNVSANSYNVTGLTNGTTYAFVVKAITVKGASDFSNVAIATPRAPGGNSGSGGGGGGRVLSNNADLADLQVWVEGKLLKLSPSFTSGTTEYTARTEGERIEIVVKEAHSAAKVIWKGKVITDSIQVDLEEGDNTIELTVQAENGTKKTYTLTIYREMPKPNEPVIAFTDIDGHWAEDYIMRAVEKGFVSGYPDGTFEPNNPVTRAEFTVMLAGALKLEGNGSELTFTDHDRIGGWAKQAVAQAVQAGIVDGYNDGSFRPNAQITRVEMAAMIARALQLQLNANASTGFADDEAIPQWAKGAVEAIRKLGIVDGRGGNRFVPNETATRAEATVMLLRLLDR